MQNGATCGFDRFEALSLEDQIIVRFGGYQPNSVFVDVVRSQSLKLFQIRRMVSIRHWRAFTLDYEPHYLYAELVFDWQNHKRRNEWGRSKLAIRHLRERPP